MLQSCRFPFVFALLIFLCAGLHAESQENQPWPQWRGPQRDGRIEAAPWPANLSEAQVGPYPKGQVTPVQLSQLTEFS